jgi:putative addiction module component (TIGR02574 family)
LREESRYALLGDSGRARLVVVTKATSKLLEDALKLDASERAELASELLASLDAEADEDAEAAWAAEIQERAARARSGEDPGKPWPEVRDRLERDLKRR